MPSAKRNYSDFWSDTEWLAVKGKDNRPAYVWRAKFKSARALNALKDIDNPRVINEEYVIKALEVAAKFASLIGRDDIEQDVLSLIEKFY